MKQDIADPQESTPLAPFRVLRRIIARVFWVLGATANLLGVYAFAEEHGWWQFRLSLSPETKQGCLMILVGMGGPWALILGGIAGVRLAELATKSRSVTRSHIEGITNVAFFFALLHMAEISVGIKIFPDYLSADGLLKIVEIYLLAGFGLGSVLPLIVRAILKRFSPRKESRPTHH